MNTDQRDILLYDLYNISSANNIHLPCIPDTGFALFRVHGQDSVFEK